MDVEVKPGSCLLTLDNQLQMQLQAQVNKQAGTAGVTGAT